ncbi:MAG: tetratricopeptide repeat protein [Planctomycetota bacterium]
MKHYWTCFWPGLSELWWRGRLSALPAAIAFAVVINVLLVAKFVYVGWMSGALVWLAILVLAAAWLVLTIRSIRELPLLLTPRAVSDEPDRFPEAQAAYLKADYATAEEALTSTLAIEPRDPPALLLLAGVFRHRGRLQAAQQLLSGMQKLEVIRHWSSQWQSEWDRVTRAIQSREIEDEPSTGDVTDEDRHDDSDVVQERSEAA